MALLKKSPEKSQQLSKAIVDEVQRIQRDVSERQAERVGYALVNFLRWAGDQDLWEIDSDLVERYQVKRLREVSLGTADKEITYLLRLLRLNGHILPKPTPKRGRVTEQRAFTPDELERFFDACPDDLRVLYLTLLATGSRPAELVPSQRSTHVALLKSEVDLQAKRIQLRSAKARGGRRGKVRQLPIPDQLVEPLSRHIEALKGRHVFLPMLNPSRQFDNILKEAGIEKVDELGRKLTNHSFRHTYATMMAEVTGNNPFVLKEILGHRQISTTAGYCHVAAAVPDLPVPWQRIAPTDAPLYVSSVCKVVDIDPPDEG
jgi:integrase